MNPRITSASTSPFDNIMFPITKLFSLSVLLAATGASTCAQAGEIVVGRIETLHGNRVHLCFRHGDDAAVGGNLAVSHHAIWNQPKGATAIRPHTVGVMKIDAIDAQHCASATLISGSAAASDWAVRTGQF